MSILLRILAQNSRTIIPINSYTHIKKYLLVSIIKKKIDKNNFVLNLFAYDVKYQNDVQNFKEKKNNQI